MSNGINTIVDCVFDISFESNVGAENFLSILANVDDFEEILKLPIHQIPDAIRKNDPNLKMQPLYEVRSKTNTDYRVVLGDNSIGIAVNNYTRWKEAFFPQIKQIFSAILDSNKIQKINRIGLRYVDFLKDENIFLTGKIKVDINEQTVVDKKMFLRVEDTIGNISYNKTISNNTKFQNNPDIGSIIDIITFIDNKNLLIDNSFDKESFFVEVDELHNVNKEKFKEVISDELVARYKL